MAVRDHFRAHARRRVDLGATLRDRQSIEEHGVRIRDLGLGGAGIELPEAQLASELLDPEASVTLEVITPNLWDPLSLRGRIAWIRRGPAGRPARAGVRFEHHDAGALYALYQLLGTERFDL
ncbi:PilZ domain-containing protein [Sorangium sp. So ce1078]|uniref:PilZ domain-containing protein n=1 Tax=unclassified Sorangium TaxID=2621164 RepID=UPI003F5D706D